MDSDDLEMHSPQNIRVLVPFQVSAYSWDNYIPVCRPLLRSVKTQCNRIFIFLTLETILLLIQLKTASDFQGPNHTPDLYKDHSYLLN